VLVDVLDGEVAGAAEDVDVDVEAEPDPQPATASPAATSAALAPAARAVKPERFMSSTFRKLRGDATRGGTGAPDDRPAGQRRSTASVDATRYAA
jgi:hypothetical protein